MLDDIIMYQTNPCRVIKFNFWDYFSILEHSVMDNTYLPTFYVALQSAQCPLNAAAACMVEVKVVLANHQKSSVCKNQFDCTSQQIGTTQK